MFSTQRARIFVVPVFLLTLSIVSSCATTSEDKPKAEKKTIPSSVDDVRNQFITGVKSQTLIRLMSLLTDDFAHEHFGDRESIHMILSESVRKGFLEDVEVSLEATSESIADDGTVLIGPLLVYGDFGHIKFNLYLKEVGKSWKIYRVIVDV